MINERIVLGFILSLILVWIIMPKFIKWLKSHNLNQVTSEYALEEFKQKEKTPVMGGLLFVLIPALVFILINPKGLLDKKTLFVLLSFLLYCTVGFLDDYTIVVKHNNEGISAKLRLVMELGYSIILYFLFKDIIPTNIIIPLINVSIEIPWFVMLIFMSLLYMAEANAVNFTDGMDGLCAGVSFIAIIPFFIFTLLINGFNNITVLLACILGGIIGYLRYNYYPAKVFMGDSGSLALGALFASLGIVLNQTIALFFIGGTFVIEMFCVVLQQLSVRLFHKRVFSYTPIHYAFVIKGYKEKQIVPSFYLFTLILVIIGFFIGYSVL